MRTVVTFAFLFTRSHSRNDFSGVDGRRMTAKDKGASLLLPGNHYTTGNKRKLLSLWYTHFPSVYFIHFQNLIKGVKSGG